MPRILLLGDSIQRSYRPYVSRLLEGRAEFVGPDDVAYADTRTTLALFEEIIAPLRPDVVHWNNGLHDIKPPMTLCSRNRSQPMICTGHCGRSGKTISSRTASI